MTLGLLWLVGCADSGAPPAELIAQAQEHREQGELRAGVIALKNALQADPENAEARHLLGETYLELGMGAAAEKELSRAQALGVPKEAIVVALGQARLQQGAYGKVLELLDPGALSGAGERAGAHALRGDAFLAQGETQAAREAYAKALEIEPNHLRARIGQARLRMALDEPAEARRRLERIVEDAPKAAKAWSLLGDLARQDEDLKAAEEAYGAAIRNRHDEGGDRLKRALVRVALGEYEAADEDIQWLEKRASGRPYVAYARGLYHFRQGHYDEAQNSFRYALDRDKSYLPAAFYAGVVHYQKGNWEQARQYLNRYHNARPDSADATRLLAMLAMRAGEYGRVKELLEPLVDRRPQDALAHNLLGTAAVNEGRFEEALRYFEKAAEVSPGSAQTQAQLGVALLLGGETARGQQALETAVDLEPELVGVRLSLIMSYYRAGKVDKAMAAARALHQERPDDAAALNMLGFLYSEQGAGDKAREAWEQALATDPGNPAASHHLAKRELAAGDVEAARRYYERSIEHYPGSQVARLALAALAASRDNTDEAIEQLKAAVDHNPESRQALVRLAHQLRVSGQPTEALAVLNDAPARLAAHPLVLAQKGRAQLAAGRAEAAVATFQQLVDARPDAAQAHYLLSQAYAGIEDPEGVQRELETALSLEADHRGAGLAYARLLLRQDELEKAARRIRSLRETYPDDPQVHAVSGALALRQDRAPAAVEAYEAALDRAQSTEWVVQLARARWRAQGATAALETLRDWVAEHPDDATVWLVLADGLLREGRRQAAREAYSEVVEREPDHAVALNNLAWLNLEDDAERAQELAERAHRIAPDSAHIKETLASALLRNGQEERALRLLREMAEQAPADPEVTVRVAESLVEVGRPDEARRLLERLLARQGEFPQRQRARALYTELGE